MSLEQIAAFLEGSDEVGFKGERREEVYGWVNQTLREQHYEALKRRQRGLVRRYVEKMTGLSRAQTTRLITMYMGGEEVKPQPYRRRRFAVRYTREDITLLAEVDAAHETLSGPATQKLLQRACYDFDDKRYFSVWRGYRWRTCTGCARSRAYRERHIQYQVTRPTPVCDRRAEEAGAERAAGISCGSTRCIKATRRECKGVYHINAVDEVTQWEVVGAVEQISEAWSAAAAGSHAGAVSRSAFWAFTPITAVSSSITRWPRLLNKLLVEQTKSRPRHSNDNGLVEAKNGAVVRKHMGYTHITGAARGGDRRGSTSEHFNPYLNFHRPCGVPEVMMDAKGKARRESTAGTRRRGRSCGSCPTWRGI